MPTTRRTADFTKPKAKLEGGTGRVLVVRDLASGMPLLAMRCRGERAAAVCAALGLLFATLGIPLVLTPSPAQRLGATHHLAVAIHRQAMRRE